MVYAFKVVTPASGTYFSRLSATRMSSATASKLLVVSKIPGDVSTDGKDFGCYRQSVESTSIQLSINDPKASRDTTCRLDSNTVYYVNAASKDLYGVPNCSSASDCGFTVEGS